MRDTSIEINSNHHQITVLKKTRYLKHNAGPETETNYPLLSSIGQRSPQKRRQVGTKSILQRDTDRRATFNRKFHKLIFNTGKEQMSLFSWPNNLNGDTNLEQHICEDPDGTATSSWINYNFLKVSNSLWNKRSKFIQARIDRKAMYTHTWLYHQRSLPISPCIKASCAALAFIPLISSQC